MCQYLKQIFFKAGILVSKTEFLTPLELEMFLPLKDKIVIGKLIDP